MLVSTGPEQLISEPLLGSGSYMSKTTMVSEYPDDYVSEPVKINEDIYVAYPLGGPMHLLDDDYDLITELDEHSIRKLDELTSSYIEEQLKE